MELPKLKQQKNAYKTHLTISTNKLTEELNKEETDRNPELLKQYVQQVDIKYQKWEAAMMQITEKDEEANVEKSMEEINTVLDAVITLKVQAKQIIEKPPKADVKVDDKPTTTTQAIKVKDRMNLPKLEMKKFSGANIEYYQEWFQIFEATIENSSLSTVEKFIYLKMSLESGSEAEKLIEGYPVTAGNYTSAVQDLHEAYGDPQVVINHHVSKLLTLPKQSGPQSLRDLHNSISTHVRSLDALGITSEQYSVFLVPIVMSKLSDSLRKDLTKLKLKDITELMKELKEEVETESSSNQVKLAFQPEVQYKDTRPQNKPIKSWASTPYQQPIATAQSLTTNTRNKYCIFCPGTQSHWVEDCRKLRNLPPNEVRHAVMSENACLGCFKKGHKISACRSRGKIKCERCQSTRHHTALHEEGKNTYITLTKNHTETTETPVHTSENPTVNNPPTHQDVEVKGATALQARLGKEATMMPIMKVRIIGNNGKKLEINAILDGCSDTSFIRSDVIKALDLDGPTSPVGVGGIAGITDSRKDRKLITTKFYNKDFSLGIDVNLVELKLICNPIPKTAVPSETLNSKSLRNLQLADDYQRNEIKEVHALIGLDYYFNFVTGKIKRSIKHPAAIETVCGWMLVTDSQNQDVQSSQNITTLFTSTEMGKSLNQDLKKFWEIEDATIEKPVKPENKAAIKKFHESVKYDATTKKYEVSLPFINEDRNIAPNYRVAEKVLQSQTRRFDRNPMLKDRYHEAMNEYIEQGFAELVPEEEIYSTEPGVYYMPHSAVMKEENTTTKTRIVFNASSSAKNQVSLNDKLLTGPKLQPSIVEILMRWRAKPVALLSDIRKMYSMIQVRENDRNSLRFLWFDKNNKLQHYRHTVLPFGVTSAPYLAIETVHSHIMKFEELHPDITESLIESTYVDDYCTAQETVEEAVNTVTVASEIMIEAGMELRKWQSNEQEVIEKCNLESLSPERKVLGINWNSTEDILYYVPKPPLINLKLITKRMIISCIASLHDPMGFISPVIIKAKMLIQQLWAAGVEWDENLVGSQIAEEYFRWSADLENLKSIVINRTYVPATAKIKNKQVHIFNDASEKGYATVAYLRSEDEEGSIYTSLITSKTKVAPLKVVTLPRLELLSAVIGSRLSLRVITALKDPNLKLHFWSDSSITLNWIKNTEVRWKTFVENRAVEIRDNSDPVLWRHCPGKENPADIASRGTTALELKESSSWWGGPSWLRKSEEHWPERMNSLVPNNEALKEKRAKQFTCLVADTTTETYVISPHRYSKFKKLLRVTAYVRRFVHNCRQKKLNNPRELMELTAEEISDAQKYWLQSVQEEYYPEELRKLKEKLPVKRDSKIIQLSPYLEEESGLIRMRGRIQHAALTEDEKHPVILPHKSPVIRLLVDEVHRSQMHSGVNHTLISLRNDFWITHARSLVKNVVKSCLICRMYMPKRLTVPMAPLPADRLTETRAFEIIGIDFTGPVIIEESKVATKRTTKKVPVQVVKVKTTSKAYIALTTCAVTRAVHIELVPDLSTDAFLRSFRRFVSRRGTCSIIYSDNAKTYKCAEKGLIQCYEILNSPKFQEFMSEKSITWKYICPLSPWWGGYWERLMKTIKIPLKKVLGRSFLTSDEMYTVLTEVEAQLNSRPLCPVNDDPEDLSYLTPANFLIGRSTVNLPVRPLRHTEVSLTATRKQLNILLQAQEKTLQKVWKVWREEYLRSLGVVPAIKEELSLKEGDLVMVASNQQPRCTWSVGRVTELLEGRDGKIRSVVVKNGGKLRTRPVQLLSKLEAANQ